MTKFFGGGTLKIVVVAGGIFDNFALGISLVVEEVGECKRGRSCLLSSSYFALLLLIAPFLLFLAFWRSTSSEH